MVVPNRKGIRLEVITSLDFNTYDIAFLFFNKPLDLVVFLLLFFPCISVP